MIELIKATESDVSSVAEIYDAVRGGEFCIWNENYPTENDAARDAAEGCLYLFRIDGELVGCASVEPEAEDDDLPFWRINDGTHREISRIAISPKHQGRGYAKVMVSMLLGKLEKMGIRSIHLLAAKRNPPAFRTYLALGFEVIGECHRYGADYFVCEKPLGDMSMP